MPASPWLAFEAGTPPALRAREVRREWERFVGAGELNGLRAPVVDSWRRSHEAGVVPASGSWFAPVAAERDEAFARWEAHQLHDASPLIRDCLAGIAEESDQLIVISDAAGMLLQLEGNARMRSLAADAMNFTEGALWSEHGSGTNAIGTALAADHAVQIFAGEHFVEVVQAWTCSAAPVHDPDTGEVIGVVDLTGLRKSAHPHTLALVVTTARAVESRLHDRLHERDNELRARYLRRITGKGGRRALVAPTGRLVADDSRGWLFGARVDVPPGGGELVLPTGDRAIAEPVGRDEAYVVRELRRKGAPRDRPRDELRMLVDEQDALRRLATAVARNVPPAEIFAAVAEEIGPLLGADDAAVFRFEPDGTAVLAAGAGQWACEMGIGMQVELDDSMVITKVFRTGSSARQDARDHGTDSGTVREENRSTVASPIIVNGCLWGAVVSSSARDPLPADSEHRMANFTELVGLVIANAESRAELTASRARVVAAATDARRKIQRDLHDGAQQRLVSTVVTLKLARQELGEVPASAAALLDEALAHAEGATRELRELAHGILPSALSRGGLRAGVDGLVARVDVPVSVEVTAERLPAELEATAYFIVAEALTNTVKHAHADSAQVAAVVDDGVLRLAVRDDGVGGAQSDGGSGLIGLRDRVAALNGELRIESRPGEGTVVAATLPLPTLLAP
ncbi:MAG TPA: GAF domain-containing protein [Thermoleophilaceae bacterium]|jgi:signal transduction histidine kinase|nr:GAF domain-containing protein [Thermoleophilaceae bacterium]